MRGFVSIFLILILAGCATVSPNPPQTPPGSEILFNETAFQQIKEGMSVDQVHTIMETSLVTGWVLEKDTYKPLTIPNPYRSQKIKSGGYRIEYYMESIRRPDGIVSDDELMPLVFQDGRLIGRGWGFVHSLPCSP